ncbi:MAG: Type I restriction-modification system, specificity subunit S (EC [uncultured Thiotrichaceae bacterium]|uniref:Type I restriction-modification system, specificity subunit S (EC) n=1 Tax=uncultured Thiotrichaceae bacterium TaxID=298394 RepID=A0A6S6TKG7_9GAMM|nr:MAG: Type I restriction-modification system, specificity subunit S (EC [uncultured Thiotrichaceae bacterium]
MSLNQSYKLGDVLNLNLITESVDPSKVYEMVGVYSYGRGLFDKGRVGGSDTSYKKFYQLGEDHIVFSQLFGWEGAISLVGAVHVGKYVSSQFPTFTVNSDIVNKRYLAWWLQQQSFWDYLKKESKGMGSRRRTINPDVILSAPINLPSLSAQAAVAKKMDEIFPKIALTKEFSESNNNDSFSLLISMSHRNDLTEQEKINQGWKLTKLDDVLTQVSNPVDVEFGQHYPHFGIYSFGKGLFAKEPLNGSEIKAKKLYRVKSGQFMYGRLNAYEGAFGVVTDELNGAHVSNEFPTFECDREHITPEFLMAYFSAPVVWENLKRNVTGIGGGAGNRRIRLKESVLLSEVIWLPPLKWQEKIKQVSEKLTTIKQEREKNLAELEELLPSILDKAFKGEL